MASTIPKTARGAWKRLALGVVTAALLLPLPAMAITFLGSWSVSQFRTGGAPAATISSSDTPGGGFLSIGMGAYNASRAAVSEVTAVRSFRVRNSGELVSLQRQFTSQLQNANLRVDVQFQRLTGRSKFSISPVTASAGGVMQSTNFNNTDSRFLTGGLYRAVITVRHQKNRSGMWSNATPYRFTFNSI